MISGWRWKRAAHGLVFTMCGALPTSSIMAIPEMESNGCAKRAMRRQCSRPCLGDKSLHVGEQPSALGVVNAMRRVRVFHQSRSRHQRYGRLAMG